MSSDVEQPKNVSGKWIVILMAPVILISAIWLSYNRYHFVHPSVLATRGMGSGATGPLK